MLFYLVVDQTAASVHVRGCYNILFMFTLKKYFMLKNPFLRFKVLHTHIRNWPLQGFSQDYDLASHATHVVRLR